MWLLPSKNPDGLKRFFASGREYGLSTPGLVLVNKDDYEANKAAYLAVLAPKNWSFVLTEWSNFSDQVREVYPQISNAPWVGILGDDCVPLSVNWDLNLTHVLNGVNVVCSQDDFFQRTGIGRATVWSGDLVRSVGELFFEDLADEADQYAAWESICKSTESLAKRPENVVRRLEPYNSIPSGFFKNWEHLHLTDAIQKVEALKEQKGIIRYTIDFTGMSVMVAVPTITGALDYEFLICAHELFSMLASHGVHHEFVVEPFNADLVMARSKLFARFMRSDCTHLFMVDADMGWDVDAFSRLVAANKDFVAVAGPKKKEPLQCAVTPVPIDDQYGQVKFDKTTGTVEVSEVGAAFCLITKEFGRKMQAAYPELEYMGMGGTKEYALFLPIITDKGIYKAEDYAFCKRWRDIGGKLYVCPDVSIRHIGRKVFQGSWASTWGQQDQMIGANNAPKNTATTT